MALEMLVESRDSWPGSEPEKADVSADGHTY